MRYAIIQFATIASLIISCILVVFLVTAKSDSFERFIFSRIDHGLTRDQLAERDIVSYSARGYLFRGMRMSETVFSGRERDHLHDVRMVFMYLQYSAIGAILLSFFLTRWLLSGGTTLGKVLWHGARAGLVFIVGASLVLYFFFDQTFELMHRLLFQNGLWQFDPLYSALVRAYTGDFFQTFGMAAMIIIFLLFCVLYAVSLCIKNNYGSFSKKM